MGTSNLSHNVTYRVNRDSVPKVRSHVTFNQNVLTGCVIAIDVYDLWAPRLRAPQGTANDVVNTCA